MKTKTLFFFLSILISLGSLPLSAQNQPEEIRSLINIARIKLDRLKKKNAQTYAKEEIKLIEQHIKDAEKALKDGQEEKALLTISIGMAYFKKIDAKIELQEAEKKLNETRALIKTKKEE